MAESNERIRQRSGESREKESRPRREISGPGAADFIAAPGGLDLPENDRSKGTGATRDEGIVAQTPLRANLDEPRPTTEREVVSEDGEAPGDPKR